MYGSVPDLRRCRPDSKRREVHRTLGLLVECGTNSRGFEVPVVASSATSRGGTSSPTTPRGVPAWTLPPVSPRANHLAKIVPLSMEGKELRRRLCHHHCRADRFSSLPPPPSAHYHRYRQRHRHCTAASSYTAINRHLGERGYQNLRISIALFAPSTNALLINHRWIYHYLFTFSVITDQNQMSVPI